MQHNILFARVGGEGGVIFFSKEDRVATSAGQTKLSYILLEQ